MRDGSAEYFNSIFYVTLHEFFTYSNKECDSFYLELNNFLVEEMQILHKECKHPSFSSLVFENLQGYPIYEFAFHYFFKKTEYQEQFRIWTHNIQTNKEKQIIKFLIEELDLDWSL